MRKIILLTALLAQSFIVEGQNRKDAPTYLPNYTPPSPSVAALMKFEEVPVDNYTGIPDVSIPIFSVTAKDAKLKFNINLKYHPSSVAVDEFASDVGLGWSLFAGGTISRTVKDLPDDILIYGKRAGIYQTEVIGSQNNYYNVVDILNNGIQTTQEQEIVDEFYWEANEKKKYDTQHDLWQFNFMGKSGRFYIKKNMTTGLLEIVPLENYNLKIKNYYQTTNNNYPGQPKYTPTSFEIIDTEGYKYLFEEFEETKTSTYSESLHFSGLLAMHPSNPITEKKYRSAFHLTKILDMSGNTLIEISYSDDFNESTITRTDVTNNSEFYATIPLDLIEQGVGEWCPEGGEAAILKTEPLSMFTLSHPEVNVKKIKDILINGVSKIHLKFEKGREDTYYYNENKGCRLTEISINDLSDVLNRKFNFKYHYDGLINIRLFLNEIDIKDKDSSEVYNYKFEYNNGTGVNIGTDYWKYYNSTATCDIGTKSKEVTPSLCTTDVLQKIKLPTGGCEIFDYESNEYTFIQGDEIGNFDENSSNWDIEPDYVNLNLQSTLGIVSYESIGYHSTPTRFIFHSSIDNNEGLNGFLKLYKKDLQLPLGHQYVLCQQLDELCPSELTVDGGFEYFVGFSWNASAGAGQNIPPNLPATGNAYVYIDKKTRAVDYKNFLYGGGIRIKKIGYFDTEVNKDYYKWNEYYSLYDSPSKEINYGYRLKSDPSKSSGVLIHPKPLYSYTKWTRVCADCFPFNGNLQVDYTTQTSYNNLLVNKTKGADVGYQNVTVYETGNGRTEFEYTIDIDGEEITDVSPPFLPSENHDYKRGLLVRQNIFDDLGKHLKKVSNQYSIEEFSEKTGLVVFNRVGENFSNSYKYPNFDIFSTYKALCKDPANFDLNCQFGSTVNPGPGPNPSFPSCPCQCYNGDEVPQIIASLPTVENYGWVKLMSTTQEDYFYDSSNNQQTVTKTESYTYNPINRNVATKTESTSLGTDIVTQYHYPIDAGMSGEPHASELIASNIIETPLSTETFRGSTKLSEQKTIYNNWGSSLLLPEIIQVAKGTQSLENRVRFSNYDEYGHPLQVQQIDAPPVSYIWGYNKSQPIAKIENCSYSSISSSLITAAQTASDTGTGLTPALNALRAGVPSSALITTYTYIPLIGVSTITDPKGHTTTYKYDSFGRLNTVIDTDGNILSENLYHYRTTSTDQNFIKTETYKVPATSTIATPTPGQAAQNVTYFDGLGRPVEKVAHKQSGTGYDIVTPITYDAWGRQNKEYLPIVSGQTLNYHGVTPTDVVTYYSTPAIPTIEATTVPFSEKLFEASPLNRVLEQAAPGNDWSMTSPVSHTIKTAYETNNIVNEVKLFKATAQWNAVTGLFDISLLNGAGNTFYPANELYKTITKNENWIPAHLKNNTTEEFKDKEGRIILKRTYTGGVAHNTYYVYDQFGNLTFVIPPKADAAINTTTLNELCYQYKYDNRNRLVEKKLPGKQWEFIVYDKLDRVVATGPAVSPFTDINAPNNVGWMLTKYDFLNRPVVTGWLLSPAIPITTADRYNLQTLYNNVSLPVNETKSTTDQINGANSFNTRYTNSAIPSIYATAYHVLTVNYYDDYTTNLTFNPAIAYTSSVTPQPVYYNNTAGTLPKGLPTVSWIRVPEATTTSPIKAEISYTLYDNKGRIVRTFKNNYLGGYTQVDSQLELMTGRVNYTLTTHKRLAASTPITIREDFTYSAQDRLLTRTHKINNGNAQLLASNTYDELGQLISKNVGTNPSTGAALQKVDYAYNIRGWLLGINKVSGLTQGTDPQDLFAFEINYNKPILNNENHTIVPLFNGNITETSWITKTDNIIRRYGYSYDALNRLKNSVYQKPFTGTTVPRSYNESLSYDKNGNITDLQRYGDLDSGSYNILIDNLTYTYHPDKQNQLMKVFDSSNHPEGFRDDSDGISDPVDDYSYDENGNLLTDENKGITAISYNHLNLPVKIIFYNDTNSRIEYLYNAQGEKVKKLVSQYCDISCVGGISLTRTDYLDGFQYTGNTLRFFPHAEGYVQNTVSGGNNIYSYVFNYTDHLGNIRASYAWNTSTSSLKILEENHYYPFGLKHGKYNVNTYSFVETDGNGGGYDSGNGVVTIKGTPRSLYQYKYQEQEWQDELGLNWYSFKWRNYDPAIGRFMNIDPLAEKYTYNSPYAFQENKMGMGREIEGLEMMPWDMLKMYYTAKTASIQNKGSKALTSVLGNTGGNTPSPSIGGYNVSKVETGAQIGEAGRKATIKAARTTANALEDTGDKTVVVSAALGQPEGVKAGEYISTSGTVLNAGLDLAEGKPISEVAVKALTSAVIGHAGDGIVDKVMDNGIAREEVERIVKPIEQVVEKKAEELISPKE